MELMHKDYLTIMKYYGINTSGMKKQKIKDEAENILAKKLCRCIKKVNPDGKDEPRAIAICNDSVLNKKGVRTTKFKCKGKPRFIFNKKTNKNLSKYTPISKKNKTRKIL